MQNRDPGWKKFGSGTRDKHPGSATLILTKKDTDQDTDPDPIRIQVFDEESEEKIQQKFFLYLLLIKNCNLLMCTLQEKPSAL